MTVLNLRLAGTARVVSVSSGAQLRSGVDLSGAYFENAQEAAVEAAGPSQSARE